jgi:hypothetical protein
MVAASGVSVEGASALAVALAFVVLASPVFFGLFVVVVVVVAGDLDGDFDGDFDVGKLVAPYIAHAAVLNRVCAIGET